MIIPSSYIHSIAKLVGAVSYAFSIQIRWCNVLQFVSDSRSGKNNHFMVSGSKAKSFSITTVIKAKPCYPIKCDCRGEEVLIGPRMQCDGKNPRAFYKNFAMARNDGPKREESGFIPYKFRAFVADLSIVNDHASHM